MPFPVHVFSYAAQMSTEPKHAWTSSEIDLILTDYFDMLKSELMGESFNKAERNRQLQLRIGRSRGSIEFKHQNISAVLELLGLPWIKGYVPLRNFQHALLESIERLLPKQLDQLMTSEQVEESGLAETTSLYIGPAPSPSQINAIQSQPALKRLIRKFDPAARDASNRALGRAGEELVFVSEQRRLHDAGQKDLARQVRWVADQDGDGAGYDVLSFHENGQERLLEVKTTVGGARTPFFLTENERAVSDEHRAEYRILRLYEFRREPKAFSLKPPLADALQLTPTIYQAWL